MDIATVVFNSNATDTVSLYGISSQCYKCDPQHLADLQSSQNLSIDIDTRWPYILHFKKLVNNVAENSSVIIKDHFHESGKYTFNISDGRISGLDLTYQMNNDPISAFMPFIIFMAALVGLSTLWPSFKCINRCIKRHRGDDTSYFLEMDEWDTKLDSLNKRSDDNRKATKNGEAKKPKSKRLRSLDTFRGIAIVIMIFVNYSGGHYYFIDHSVWNGLTVADLVFPWFIFIMGMSINLSYKSFIKRGAKKSTTLFQISFRSLKLFIIGLVLNKGQNLVTWRVPGVLQRFGVCYFVVASINLLTTPSQTFLYNWAARRCVSPFRDVIPYWFQWIIILAIIAGHTAITFLLPVPGCPKGYLGPGGLAEGGKFFNCTGGAAGYIDYYILGARHIYGHPTCEEIYRTTQAFDPEGLLGFLPTIVLTFLGLQAGRTLYAFDGHSSRVKRWLVWALITGAVGFGLTLGTQDEGIIPINKNLWSISFVLVTASTAFVLFIICYIACDVLRIWNGSPFFFCGMNAIFLYIGHSLIPLFIYWHVDPQSHTSYLVVATFNTVVWVTWAFVLYKKRLFFTV